MPYRTSPLSGTFLVRNDPAGSKRTRCGPLIINAVWPPDPVRLLTIVMTVSLAGPSSRYATAAIFSGVANRVRSSPQAASPQSRARSTPTRILSLNSKYQIAKNDINTNRAVIAITAQVVNFMKSFSCVSMSISRRI